MLSSESSMLNYEEDLYAFERNLNKEIQRNRKFLLNQFQKISSDYDDKKLLKEINESLINHDKNVIENKGIVANLRGQILEVENISTRMIRKTESCKKIIEIADRML